MTIYYIKPNAASVMYAAYRLGNETYLPFLVINHVL